jgi:hypothetical protein
MIGFFFFSALNFDYNCSHRKGLWRATRFCDKNWHSTARYSLADCLAPYAISRVHTDHSFVLFGMFTFFSIPIPISFRFHHKVAVNSTSTLQIISSKQKFNHLYCKCRDFCKVEVIIVQELCWVPRF